MPEEKPITGYVFSDDFGSMDAMSLPTLQEHLATSLQHMRTLHAFVNRLYRRSTTLDVQPDHVVDREGKP